mmetsp:Transcript_6998/g.12561  ORF Transcript_6998/g.12561 Transcript_6998/m.12561 type:complete len:198 (+) Transcript_6998:498-1091(+)
MSRIRTFLASTRSLSTLKECDRLWREARRCALAMKSLAGDDTMKIRDAQNKLDRDVGPIGREITRALDEKQGRDFLMEGARPSYVSPTLMEEGGGASSEVDSLIANSEALLLETQSICANTEQIGNSTLDQMGSQREQLYITSEHVHGTRSRVDQARALLINMRKRALRNKLFLYSIILFLVLANCGMLYYIIFKKK